MEELFKNALYTGVGIISGSAERYKVRVNELVRNGKLNEMEGKKLLNEWSHEVDSRIKEFDLRLNEILKQLLDKFYLPVHKDFSKLKTRIEALESRLEE